VNAINTAAKRPLGADQDIRPNADQGSSEPTLPQVGIFISQAVPGIGPKEAKEIVERHNSRYYRRGVPSKPGEG
jgi:hypothetical protein